MWTDIKSASATTMDNHFVGEDIILPPILPMDVCGRTQLSPTIVSVFYSSIKNIMQHCTIADMRDAKDVVPYDKFWHMLATAR